MFNVKTSPHHFRPDPNESICRPHINSFPKKPWFLHVCSISLFKTLGKGEIAPNKQFLLFPRCFYRYRNLPAIFIKSESGYLEFLTSHRIKKKIYQ